MTVGLLGALFDLGCELRDDSSSRPEMPPWRPGTYGGWAGACVCDLLRAEHAVRLLDEHAAAAGHRALPNAAIDQVTARTATLVASLLKLGREVARDVGEDAPPDARLRTLAVEHAEQLLQEARDERDGFLHCAEAVGHAVGNIIDFRRTTAPPGGLLVVGPLLDAIAAALAGGAAAIIDTRLADDDGIGDLAE